MYSELKPLHCGDDLNMVQAADTSLYKLILPSNHREIVVRAITQRVQTAAGDTTSGAVKLLNGSTVVATCTGVGVSAAVGTTTYDAVTDGTTGQRFKAGDTLDVQVATACTTTGKFQVILWID
jgi:hypothetical protein